MGVAKIMIRGRRRMQKTIVTNILKMISTIAVIVLSPLGYFSRLPYCALMCCYLIERLGSGDGERKTLLTRQIAFEPLPASVLFARLLRFGFNRWVNHIGGVLCSLSMR
jgi:hypothetical protein